MCTKAPEFCSRNCTAQARLMLKEPLRWTARTSDQSDQLMRWKMRSRRMPALLTRMSTRPKAVSAALTISSAFLGSAMESVDAIASPPPALISLTTSWAGPASAPAPSRLAPMSQTTTRAPSCASNSAIPRPMPRAAPVTIATLPATIPEAIWVDPRSTNTARHRPAQAGDPVAADLPGARSPIRHGGILDAPPTRGMTREDFGPQSAPDLFGDLDHPAQFRPLLVLGQ